jgi:putative drug exporter of the RND superfamily
VLNLARWCIQHRRRVVLGWAALAVALSVIAGVVGRKYATNFTLPGTESQRAQNLLVHEFPQQGGDLDTIVFHTSRGTIASAQVRAAMVGLLARVEQMPHVVAVVSPYGPHGGAQVSRDQRTAFASVYYDKRANQLPDSTGKPVLRAVARVRVPALSVAAGGPVIEQAEGFSIGPATIVGVIAALVILLITFGSLLAAGMPLLTAGLGLVTGVAVIGLATHLTSMSDVSPELALMIGLGVGVDYALFIVTRFRESYARLGRPEDAVVEAMDTSGRAILLAGTTVVIALLGMFATGVSFMYGLAIASVFTVLLTMLASLTVLPALLARWGEQIARPGRRTRRRAPAKAIQQSAWRRWSLLVQAHPWPLALAALAVVLAFVIPITSLRLDNSDAGNDPSNTSSYRAFNLLSKGFGPGFNGPLALVVQFGRPGDPSGLPAITAALSQTRDIASVSVPRVSPSGRLAVIRAYPASAPQAPATTQLVNNLRHTVLPPLERAGSVRVLVGGFTAGSIDFGSVLASKLPVFIAIVVVLSALLLFVMFRSLVVPLQAAVMNLLSIGGALGATVAVFQLGWLAGPLGVQRGPVEPWIPVLMFAVVFGLSMDYEVFLVSRMRESWDETGENGRAVALGLERTGRIVTAAAVIMVAAFSGFLAGRIVGLQEFGLGLAVAIFVDATIVRAILVPALMAIMGRWNWWLPARVARFARVAPSPLVGG